MRYRGLAYFFILSCFFYIVLFSEITLIGKEESRQQTLISRLLNLPEEEQSRIVETFIELEKSEPTKNISTHTSRAQGKITPEKGYSYYNDIRFLQIPEPKKQEKTPDPDGAAAVEAPQKTEIKPVDILPNLYQRKKITINMDSDGLIGVSAEKKDYVAYLTALAKKVFYHWMEFVPAMQIHQKLITTAPNGMIEGSVGIYFRENTTEYDVVIVVPFASDTMNKLTERSFTYLRLPSPPASIKLNLLLIRLSISPAMRAEAEFKFDLHEKKKSSEP